MEPERTPETELQDYSTLPIQVRRDLFTKRKNTAQNRLPIIIALLALLVAAVAVTLNLGNQAGQAQEAEVSPTPTSTQTPLPTDTPKPSAVPTDLATPVPSPTPKPLFGAVIYKLNTSAEAYVDSSSPLDLLVRADDPAAASQPVTIHFYKGSGTLTTQDGQVISSGTNLPISLDTTGTARLQFHAADRVSEVVIGVAVPSDPAGSMVEVGQLAFTSRLENLTLSYEPINLTLGTPQTLELLLNSDDLSPSPRLYPLSIAMSPDTVPIQITAGGNEPLPNSIGVNTPLSLNLVSEPEVAMAPFLGTVNLNVTYHDQSVIVPITWSMPCTITITSELFARREANGTADIELPAEAQATAQYKMGNFYVATLNDTYGNYQIGEEVWLATEQAITPEPAEVCENLPAPPQ